MKTDKMAQNRGQGAGGQRNRKRNERIYILPNERLPEKYGQFPCCSLDIKNGC
jgi:hypothetical protein